MSFSSLLDEVNKQLEATQALLKRMKLAHDKNKSTENANQLSKLKAEMANLVKERNHTVALLTKTVKDLRSDVKSKETKLTDCTTEEGRMKTENSGLKKTVSDLQAEVSQIKRQDDKFIDELKRKYDESQQEVGTLKKQLESTSQELKNVRTKLAEFEASYKKKVYKEDAESKRKQQADEAAGGWNETERKFIKNATKEQFCNQDDFPPSVKPRHLDCKGKTMKRCSLLAHPNFHDNDSQRLFTFMQAVLEQSEKIKPGELCP